MNQVIDGMRIVCIASVFAVSVGIAGICGFWDEVGVDFSKAIAELWTEILDVLRKIWRYT